MPIGPKEWSPRRGFVTRKEVLDAANRHYPERFLAHYYDKEGRLRMAEGDILAEFIVHEVSSALEDAEHEPYSDEEMIGLAIRRLDTSIDDVTAAMRGLRELAREVKNRKKARP